MWPCWKGLYSVERDCPLVSHRSTEMCSKKCTGWQRDKHSVGLTILLCTIDDWLGLASSFLMINDNFHPSSPPLTKATHFFDLRRRRGKRLPVEVAKSTWSTLYERRIIQYGILLHKSKLLSRGSIICLKNGSTHGDTMGVPKNGCFTSMEGKFWSGARSMTGFWAEKHLHSTEDKKNPKSTFFDRLWQWSGGGWKTRRWLNSSAQGFLYSSSPGLM